MVFAFAKNKRLSLASLANGTNGLHSARVVWAHTRVSPSTRVLAAVSAVGLVLLGIAIGLDVKNVDVPVSYVVEFKPLPSCTAHRMNVRSQPPPWHGTPPHATPFTVLPHHLEYNTTTPHPTPYTMCFPTASRCTVAVLLGLCLRICHRVELPSGPRLHVD